MYRRNVVAVIFNEDGEVLACNRMDRKGWQFVQGGVEDTDTELEHAAWREIEEEVGLLPKHGVQYVASIEPPNGDPTALRYLFPKYAAPSLRAMGYVGQQQELLLFFAPKDAIRYVRVVPSAECLASGVKQEFRSAQWMPFSEFLPKTAHVKRHIFVYLNHAAPPLIRRFLESRDDAPCETKNLSSQSSSDAHEESPSSAVCFKRTREESSNLVEALQK